jgi:hypothetical protein
MRGSVKYEFVGGEATGSYEPRLCWGKAAKNMSINGLEMKCQIK